MLQKTNFTFWGILKNYAITIPMIQRDYAQGREDIKTKSIRDEFVKILVCALKNDESMSLDFVYGSVDNGIFIPLDGQQRLTTLFLLHWYIVGKTGDLQDQTKKYAKWLKRFTYETRTSSRDFCKALVEAKGLDFSNNEKFSASIEDSPWFLYSWKKDPTIKSMLVMLNTIQENLNGIKEEDYPNILKNLITNKKISFHFLPIDNFGLTDELYIKMNARGKTLTDFENFKAWLEKTIEKKKIQISIENWQEKLDNEWTDLFWYNRNKENDDYLIDSEYMRFFIELSGFKNDQTEVIKNLHDTNFINTTSYFEGNQIFNNETINFIFNSLSKIFDNKFKNLLLNTSFIKDYINIEEVFKKLIYGKITYEERILFYAFIAYINRFDVKNNDDLFHFMRFVRNLIKNHTINAENFVTVIASINEICNNGVNFLENLSKGNLDKIPFFGTQIREEEKTKAILILKDIKWKSHILEAENNSFFKGKINFLLENGENCDFDTFVKRKNVAVQLFDEKGVTIGKDVNLFGRVLLSLGLDLINNDLYLGGMYNQYWKGYLNNSYFIPFILQAFDLLIDGKNKNNFESIFENKLQSVSNLPKWKEILIKNGDFFKCYSHYGRIKQDWRGINIYAQEKFNSVTNAILIENNRNELIDELISCYGFEIVREGAWCHTIILDNKNYYSGDNIKLTKKTIENETIDIIFERNQLKVNNQSIYDYDSIDKLKKDFSHFF